MTRRPLPHQIERLAKAQSRMAPGGMLWSESPIPKRFSPRVPTGGEEPAAAEGYAWALDDTTAPFAEAAGGPGLENNGAESVLSYHQPGLAPGSTYAVGMQNYPGSTSLVGDLMLDNYAAGHNWAPNPGGGVVGFDVWVKNVAPLTVATFRPRSDFIQMRLGSVPGFDPILGDGNYPQHMYYATAVTNAVRFQLEEVVGGNVSITHTFLTLASPWPTTMHLRWEITPGTSGRSRIWVNDALTADETRNMPWLAGDVFRFHLLHDRGRGVDPVLPPVLWDSVTWLGAT